MPYDSYRPQGKRTKKNIFDHVRWSMEFPTSDEDEAINYYNRFLDLAEPLLDSRLLDSEECDALFWCGFHPDDRVMLLCRLCEYSNPPSGVHFRLRKVFKAARKIFSQRPAGIRAECRDALRWGPRFRRPHDDQRKCGPSLSQSQAQDLVEDLEVEVAYRRKRAQEEEDWEVDRLIGRL
jgi:hypothetical protein